jgi:DNA replication protein DnaC
MIATEAAAEGINLQFYNLVVTDVLLVDDFAMAPLSDDERRSFLEVCDDRYGRRSSVLTSQLPVESWHAQIGDPSPAS